MKISWISVNENWSKNLNLQIDHALIDLGGHHNNLFLSRKCGEWIFLRQDLLDIRDSRPVRSLLEDQFILLPIRTNGGFNRTEPESLSFSLSFSLFHSFSFDYPRN